MPWLSDQVWRRLAQGEARRLSLFIAQYALVGVLAGLAAVGFRLLVDAATAQGIGRFADLGGVVQWPSWPQGDDWWVFALPGVGGLVCGLLVWRWAPEVAGPGTGAVIRAYHHDGGRIRKRVPLAKGVASAVVLGSGGSAGVEGPIGHISAGIGAVLGGLLRVSPDRRRVLMMAGFAAGIGAIFHAPMASAFFAAEVLYHQMDIEHRILVPSIIASVVAYAVFGAIAGWTNPYDVGHVSFSGPELLPYTVLAIVLVPVGALFVRLYGRVKEAFGASPLPTWLRPALAGVGVGLIGLLVPQALGGGEGLIRLAIGGDVGIAVLLLLVAAKLLATVLTVGSGASGGLFAPTLVLGGLLGGAVGLATTELFPTLGVTPASFVVVGMAGFFAGVANAPLSTVIMVSELVGSYALIVPALWVCTLTWLLSRRVVLFSEQVPTAMDAPSGLADMMSGVLERLTVRDAMRPWGEELASVLPDTGLRELVEVFAHSTQSVFPIIDAEGRLRGVVDGRQLRAAIGASSVDALLIANDFQTEAVYVRPDDDLRGAVATMTRTGFDELLVVDERDHGRLVGVLSRREVVAAYHRTMLDLQLRDAPGGEPGGVGLHSAEGAGDDDACDGLLAAVKRGGIHARIEGDTPEEVLNDMLARAPLPPEVDRPRLLALLLEREALSSTAIGGGVALPHPHSDDLVDFAHGTVIIGMLRRPVAWGAPDGRPVHTVCILLSPSGAAHLTLLGALARALSDERLRHVLEHRAPRRKILERLRELTEES